MSEETIETKLARIEERQIGNTKIFTDCFHELKTTIDKNSGRITALESWRTWLIGIAFGVSTCISFVVAKLHGKD